MNNAPSLYQFKNLSFRYPGSHHQLYFDISFDLNLGDFVIIRGRNGSGKTTLLNNLFRELNNCYQCEILPQMYANELPFPITLKEIVSNDLSHDYVDKQVNLLSEDQLALDWGQTSGGQKKRALLTKALQKRSEILFLDEPLNHLDIQSQKEVLNFLKHFLESGKLRAIIVVMHEYSLVEKMKIRSKEVCLAL